MTHTHTHTQLIRDRTCTALSCVLQKNLFQLKLTVCLVCMESDHLRDAQPKGQCSVVLPSPPDEHLPGQLLGAVVDLLGVVSARAARLRRLAGPCEGILAAGATTSTKSFVHHL